MANYKVDIFDILNRLSIGEQDIWSSLSEEEQKAISPLIVMRWLSGTSSKRQIVYLNTLVNHLVFSLSKHPDLLFKLMTCCTEKHPARYQWLGQKKSGPSKKLSVQVLQNYYGYSSREATKVLPLLNRDDIIRIAENLGWEKEELTKLKKEL